LDAIGNISKIVEQLRLQMSERTARAGKSFAGQRFSPSSKTARPTESTFETLQAKIGERIRAIDLNDSHRKKKANRIFLESVLLFEFGNNLMDDPAFYLLVEDIQNLMESDEATSLQLDCLVEQLTKET